MKIEKFIALIGTHHLHRASIALSKIGITVCDADGKFKDTSTLLEELSKKFEDVTKKEA